MKILVVKRDKLGDLLLTSPLLFALRRRYPEATIDLLASDYNAWVATGHPAIDQLLVYRRAKVGKKITPSAVIDQVIQFAKLRRARYDVALVAQGEDSPRATKRAIWTGAKRVIAFVDGTQRYGAGLTDPLPLPIADHEAARLLELGQPLGIDQSFIDDAPWFQLPVQYRSFAQRWLAENGLSQGAFMVMGLGARRARKQPSAEQVLRWSEWAHRQFGLKTVFMWTPGDASNPLYPGDDAIAAPVLAANAPWIVPFRGPLKEAVALVFHARLSIFPDSGLMHFASASPGSVIGLFGDSPEFVAKWRPLGARARTLSATQVSQLADDQLTEAIASLAQAPLAMA